MLAAIPWASPLAAGTLSVFAGVEPVRYLAAAVGGDRVDVAVLVPPGQNPHSFEPSPRQVAALESADLYLATGMPFEDAWTARLKQAMPGLRVVNLASGPSAGHDHGAKHGDPHPWTDPLRAVEIGRAVQDALSEADPAGASRYQAGFDDLAAALHAAHEAMARSLEPVRGRSIFVYHPAWGALADRYGLRQVAVEAAGKSPGGRHLAGVIEQAREAGACAIFAQPQFSDRAAARVAEELGARMVELDPMAGDLPAHLPCVARTLARYLEQPCPP